MADEASELLSAIQKAETNADLYETVFDYVKDRMGSLSNNIQAITHNNVRDEEGLRRSITEDLAALRELGGAPDSHVDQHVFVEHVKPFLDQWGARLERLAAGPQPREDRPLT